ncbi:MAG: hypothetical protein U9Q84_05935 [Thermodesulfobacteriota bacterium]|nr:hypothetical protein [Thermodesulfobacteriota bacterium]
MENKVQSSEFYRYFYFRGLRELRGKKSQMKADEGLRILSNV